MGKKARRAYALTSAILVIAIPQLVMSGEDGNLLVRIAMTSILATVLYAAYHILRKILGKRDRWQDIPLEQRIAAKRAISSCEAFAIQ